jgi:mono/diheme cytochrome c family protein
MMLCAAFAGLAPAPCALAADRSAAAAKGKAAAAKACAGCHDISDDLKAAPDRRPGMPPSFLTIAESRTLDAARLGAFLRTPHGEMDHLLITRHEIDEVVAYIMSLRRK